jgi:hypothetical protein
MPVPANVRKRIVETMCRGTVATVNGRPVPGSRIDTPRPPKPGSFTGTPRTPTLPEKNLNYYRAVAAQLRAQGRRR